MVRATPPVVVFVLPDREPVQPGHRRCNGPLCVGRTSRPGYYFVADPPDWCVECAAARGARHPLDGRVDPGAEIRLPVVAKSVTVTDFPRRRRPGRGCVGGARR